MEEISNKLPNSEIDYLSELYPDYKITKEHGSWVQRNGIWMTAIYHPSALLRDLSKRPETFDDLMEIRYKLNSLDENGNN